MPTYEYIREDGTRFEWIHSIKIAPFTTCPTTGQACKLVIKGGCGTIFKGEWNDKKS